MKNFSNFPLQFPHSRRSQCWAVAVFTLIAFSHTQFINFLFFRNETWIVIMRLLTFELITRSPLLRMKRQIESILIDQLHNFSLQFNLFSRENADETNNASDPWNVTRWTEKKLKLNQRTCSSELNDGRRRHFGSLFGSIIHEEQVEKRESRENSKKISEKKF